MITGSKKRKVDCGFLYCGGDAIIGNNLNVAGTITGNVDITPQITDLASGSASVPSVGFASSSNTGIYLNTSNSGLAITASGTNIGTFYLNGSTPELLMGTHGVVYAPSGFIGVPFISNGDSSSDPGHTWSSDTKTGLYLPSLGKFGFSSGGTSVANVTSNGLIMLSRTQQWTVASLGSGSGVYAATFTTPSSTPSFFTNILTYTQDTVNGDTWTISQTGTYNIRFGRAGYTSSGTSYFGVSRNVSATTAMTSWTSAELIGARVSNTGYDNDFGAEVYPCFLNSGDVIRACIYATGGVTAINSGSWFEITYIGGNTSSLS